MYNAGGMEAAAAARAFWAKVSRSGVPAAGKILQGPHHRRHVARTGYDRADLMVRNEIGGTEEFRGDHRQPVSKRFQNYQGEGIIEKWAR